MDHRTVTESGTARAQHSDQEQNETNLNHEFANHTMKVCIIVVAILRVRDEILYSLRGGFRK